MSFEAQGRTFRFKLGGRKQQENCILGRKMWKACAALGSVLFTDMKQAEMPDGADTLLSTTALEDMASLMSGFGVHCRSLCEIRWKEHQPAVQ